MRPSGEGPLGSLVRWLGSLSPRFAIPFALASLVVFLGGVAVEDHLTLQTDPVLWVNQHSQNRKDVATLEDQTDASSELGVFVVAKNRDELFSDATAHWVDRFTDDSVKRYPDLILVGSNLLTPLRTSSTSPAPRTTPPPGP